MMEAFFQQVYGREEVPACDTSNEYDGRLGLRISAIFVILIGSMGGALIPILMGKRSAQTFPRWVFFFSKYFGSGVIIATAYKV
ncbi:Uncharacterized protein TPAR_05950 [Tolypocladium paradoxum]|uniref:Uncharacterized protein n=1 Tax=Tolypocladium paradoxum TaxID=94208 RepID=A0A2S4KUI2_9HYPO|nr:Uncharacterized protein TPAR_05950 [Tolypocladium paradoxum]